ncbi:MAG: hypothetical protein ABL883_05485 [Terricaulis sp.]
MRKSMLSLALMALALSAPSPAYAQQEACGIFVLGEGDQAELIPTPGYTVLTAIPPLARPPGQARVDAIVCDRSGLFLGPADYRVLMDLAMPLYIRHDGRVAVLEAVEGRLQVRLLHGALREGESEALADALDRAEAAIAAIPR